MTKTPDPESIAKAMREAAWIAIHGAREERSGRFVTPTTPVPEDGAPPKKSAAARP